MKLVCFCAGFSILLFFLFGLNAKATFASNTPSCAISYVVVGSGQNANLDIFVYSNIDSKEQYSAGVGKNPGDNSMPGQLLSGNPTDPTNSPPYNFKYYTSFVVTGGTMRQQGITASNLSQYHMYGNAGGPLYGDCDGGSLASVPNIDQIVNPQQSGGTSGGSSNSGSGTSGGGSSPAPIPPGLPSPPAAATEAYNDASQQYTNVINDAICVQTLSSGANPTQDDLKSAQKCQDDMTQSIKQLQNDIKVMQYTQSGTGNDPTVTNIYLPNVNSWKEFTTGLSANSQQQLGTLTGKVTDPCYGKIGDDRNQCQAVQACKNNSNVASCEAQKMCEASQAPGHVFLPAFNDACDTLPDFMQTLIDYVLLFSSIIAGIMFLRSAYGILVSRGDPSALADAKDTLLHAILGIVLVAVAFALLKVLNGAFGSISPGINLLGPFTSL